MPIIPLTDDRYKLSTNQPYKFNPSAGLAFQAAGQEALDTNISTRAWRQGERSTRDLLDLLDGPGHDEDSFMSKAAYEKSPYYRKDITFDKGEHIETIKDIVARHDRRIAREEILANSQHGGAAFAASMIGSFIDPVNIAVGFVPVVGEVRLAAAMERAGTNALARGLIRAGAGFAEGTAGAAMVEPLNALMSHNEQDTYGAAEALTNILVGGVTGGALHTGLGALGDAVRYGLGVHKLEEAGRGSVAQMYNDEPVNVIPTLTEDINDFKHMAFTTLEKRTEQQPWHTPFKLPNQAERDAKAISFADSMRKLTEDSKYRDFEYAVKTQATGELDGRHSLDPVPAVRETAASYLPPLDIAQANVRSFLHIDGPPSPESTGKELDAVVLRHHSSVKEAQLLSGDDLDRVAEAVLEKANAPDFFGGRMANSLSEVQRIVAQELKHNKQFLGEHTPEELHAEINRRVREGVSDDESVEESLAAEVRKQFLKASEDTHKRNQGRQKETLNTLDEVHKWLRLELPKYTDAETVGKEFNRLLHLRMNSVPLESYDSLRNARLYPANAEGAQGTPLMTVSKTQRVERSVKVYEGAATAPGSVGTMTPNTPLVEEAVRQAHYDDMSVEELTALPAFKVGATPEELLSVADDLTNRLSALERKVGLDETVKLKFDEARSEPTTRQKAEALQSMASCIGGFYGNVV